ncbi:hypothetical protein BD289DRAFT_377767 [Coniella lustricola]|uniref:Uncharacterized protein n=1 Tax=Coniella lustricola TaxID=2025994 RepID=A0A2T2ZUZ0_9PEZI|nr:hypothetical protein BD289DRAFT_377767 [Coniella lustricola]
MAATTTGRRMLGEIEETRLDEVRLSQPKVLQACVSRATALAPTSINGALPASLVTKGKTYPIPALNDLVTRHHRATESAPLSLSGRQLPLIYILVAALVSAPQRKAVVVIDLDAKFDITRVLQSSAAEGTALRKNDRVTVDDLKHVHIYRASRRSPSQIRDVLKSAEHHMVYGKHASTAREWWGTIVVGGGNLAAFGSEQADVTTGWKGWLRVDRGEVSGFQLGTSVQEALVDRDQRQRAADAAGYKAMCVWGDFSFDR